MSRPALHLCESRFTRFAVVFCLGVCAFLPSLPASAAVGEPGPAPSLSSVAASLEHDVSLLQKLISELGPDGATAVGGDLAVEMSSLRAQVGQLTSRNQTLSADHEKDKADMDALLKDYEDLRARYDALASQKDDSEDKAVQLETALMLIDTYEQTISKLDARVSELEEKIALLLKAAQNAAAPTLAK